MGRPRKPLEELTPRQRSNRAYRDRHAEQIAEKKRLYDAAHRMKRTAQHRAWRERNRERDNACTREYQREYRRQYPEAVRARKRAWLGANREHARAYQRAYMREWRRRKREQRAAQQG